MNKQELIDAIAESINLPKVAIESVINSLVGHVQDELSAGGEVTLPGLGKFSVIDKAAKTGRNPKTGETIQIAAKRAPKFSAAKALKDAAAA